MYPALVTESAEILSPSGVIQ